MNSDVCKKQISPIFFKVEFFQVVYTKLYFQQKYHDRKCNQKKNFKVEVLHKKAITSNIKVVFALL